MISRKITIIICFIKKNYPFLIRLPAALYVRAKEHLLSPFFDHFILAEKTYMFELSFLKKDFSVLENKTLVPDGWKKKRKTHCYVSFLFSGTITESNGIYEAIELFRNIQLYQPDSVLIICGHCPGKKLNDYLKSIEGASIQLIINPTPISHKKILDQIEHCDFGIVSYRINKSNEHCMPTKVFEYLALGLPVLCENGSHWENIILDKAAGMSFQKNLSDTESLVKQISSFNHVSDLRHDSELVWIEEGEQLKSIISNLL